MNWYEKHLGDWAKKTQHLTMLEEGAYNRLCDWCYAHERPLPLAMKDVYRVARAVTPTERAAVQRLTSEFFTLAPDGWHQGRIDKTLAQYAERVSRATNNPMSAAERARRYREKRAELFKRAASMGLNPTYNARNEELQAMIDEASGNGQSSRDGDVTVTRLSRQTVTGKPTTNNQPLRDGLTPPLAVNGPSAVAPAAFAAAARESAEAAGIVDPTLTGAALKALKGAGFSSFNAADPRFLALVRQGVTDDEWRLTAAEAVARSKGWGWLLATISGRRSDVANGYAVLKPGKAPNGRERGSVAGLTPTIAAKPPF